ncbi:peroxidase-like [Maniola jurtina]|uniref:peroxidase-like n=1 Tax=Maniola jurtina TaxID=191418 RepID=UPI001E68601B|nr:peroxidase-like [Maniola jurtina]
MFVLFFGLFVCACAAQSVFYDSYSGNTVSNEVVKGHIKQNTTFWCLNELLPCNPLEGRRVDGSCNNLKNPNRGSAHTPMLRLLPAEYDKDFEPRRSKNGDPLPLPRKLRTWFLPEGHVPDTAMTQLLPHFWVFIVSDMLSVHDTVNYIQWKPYCCQEKGKTDSACIPIKITDDDPVHRFSSIRCMNLTRPESFQSRGCLRNNTTPERITTATPLLDLSHVYGNSMQVLNAKGRLFEKGLLKFEVSGGKIWPPSSKTNKHLCFLNQLPHETRCHDIPELGANSVLGVNLYLIWTWRLHNRIAMELSKINPCWDDERTFFTTRDMVIAIIMQIYYYELMPALMGYENLVADGVISGYPGFRDMYDETVLPQITLEMPFVLRWAHTIQEGNLKMYDTKGNFLKETKLVNLTLRTGYLDDNLEYITHGSFRQPSGKFDYVVDPDIAETVLGPHQLAADVFSSDLTKNRYFGFPPYIKYRKYCSGKTYRTFDDLLDVIDPERVELLKERYKNIEDMDLIAGLWLEKYVPGGRTPYTFYCIVVDQMLRSVVSDRHWYERQNRPNAFTLEQLLEIRKASAAQMLCAVGDKVTKIQPHAFYLAGPGNEMRSCEKINKINLWAWKDASCEPKNPFSFDFVSNI